MSIFVVGATSQIGVALLPMLDSNRRRFIALSRTAPSSSAYASGDFIRGELPALPAMENIDTVISFGPMDAVAQWLDVYKPGSIKRVIATSSMSAVSKQNSKIDADRELSQTLRNNEKMLMDVCKQQGIIWTLFRPTMIYGVGIDKNLTPIARKAQKWHVFPRINAGGLRQPVHAEDIAHAVMRALDRPESHQQIFEIGGGERLTVAEMFRRVEVSLPVKTLPLPVPMVALRALANIIPAWRGPYSRLREDLIADNHALEQRLQISPRGFQPDNATWNVRA